MSYQRVIPRDLFIESKLLKCLGQLALIAHDGRDSAGRRPARLRLELDAETHGFMVEQSPADGSLSVKNLTCWAGDQSLELFIPYGSRDPYPLFCMTEDEELSVFLDDGSLDPDFLHFLDRVAADHSFGDPLDLI